MPQVPIPTKCSHQPKPSILPNRKVIPDAIKKPRIHSRIFSKDKPWVVREDDLPFSKRKSRIKGRKAAANDAAPASLSTTTRITSK